MARKRRRTRSPEEGAKKAREPFIGFRAPGQRYQGRIRSVPTTQLSAFGGGVAYDSLADLAEGEPEEMRGSMEPCVRPPALPSLPRSPARH